MSSTLPVEPVLPVDPVGRAEILYSNRKSYIPRILFQAVGQRKPAGKRTASFTLEPESIEWLDRVVKEKRFRNKSHAVDWLIQQERQRGS